MTGIWHDDELAWTPVERWHVCRHGCRHVRRLSRDTADIRNIGQHDILVAHCDRHMRVMHISSLQSAMEQQFVTVSQARKLTGVSERTIRRFLKDNVTEHPSHFQQKHSGGRSIWLIDVEFLSKRYPLKNASEFDSILSGDSGTDTTRDNRGLSKQWQQSKANQEGSASNPTGDAASTGRRVS